VCAVSSVQAGASTSELQRFRADVLRNPFNAEILQRWPALHLPDAWLVAGCLFQTVWNLQAGEDPARGIKDYDLFYFDSSDTSAETERQVQAHVQTVLGDLGVDVEACNQARVHEWYPDHFGHPYPRLRDACDGIDHFLVLATCVGVQPHTVYAPNGLASLYRGELRMNPLTPHQALFEQKVASYRQRWPWLRVA
jgi:uncharacterized protein